MTELAFTLLSLGFLAFMALESHRILSESPRTSRRLVAQPVRVRSKR